jgi:hypothetical protein
LRYAGPQGDRRSSGERKPSGETAVAAELKEICIPLRDARVSLDDDALAFAVNIPPGVAKHCEFKFRCADAAELQEWYGTLARLCSSVPPPSSVDVLETALEALQVGPSSATAASLSAEAHGFDLVSRSLPAKLDVRTAFCRSLNGITLCRCCRCPLITFLCLIVRNRLPVSVHRRCLL